MAGRYKVVPRESRTADGIVFDSGHEMEQYLYLKAMQRCGAITDLKLQVKFPLWAVNPETGETATISHWVADFVFTGLDGKITYADAKGHRTKEYLRTKKWWQFCYAPRYIVEL